MFIRPVETTPDRAQKPQDLCGMHLPMNGRVMNTGTRIKARGAGLACAQLALTLVCSVGCTSDPEAGELEQTVAPYVFTVVPWVRDTSGAWFLFDTGSPRSMVRPAVVGLPDGTFGDGDPAGFEVPGLPLPTHPLLITEALPARLLRVEASGEITGLGGVIGADTLSEFRFAIDPIDSRVFINDLAGTRYGDGEPLSLDVELRGGGRTCIGDDCWSFGATRLIVPITIGGVSTHALVDTAATYVTVSRSLMGRLEARGPVSRLFLDTEAGPANESYARVPEVRVAARGGQAAVLSQVPLLVGDPATMDPAFARLHVETGRRVEVLLGHSFLRRFVTEIDFRVPSVDLHRLDDPPLDLDRFETFGVWLSVSDDCWTVSRLVRDSSLAREGLRVGDCIGAINGAARSDLSEVEARSADLVIGTELTLSVRRGAENQTYIARVEDHLPPAQ